MAASSEEKHVVVVSSSDDSSEETEDHRTLAQRVQALETARMFDRETIDELEGRVVQVIDNGAQRDLQWAQRSTQYNARINARVTGAAFRAGMQQVRDEIQQLETLVTETNENMDNQVEGLRVHQEDDSTALNNLQFAHNEVEHRVHQLNGRVGRLTSRADSIEVSARIRHEHLQRSIEEMNTRLTHYIELMDNYFTLLERDAMVPSTVVTSRAPPPMDFTTTAEEVARRPVYYGPIRRRRFQLRITYVPYQRRVNRRLDFDNM